MLRFSSKYPLYKFPVGAIKQLKARYLFFDHPIISIRNRGKYGIFKLDGHQSQISRMRNKHKGQRVFIIANGPSLKEIDMSLLKNEFTIGCNGIYRSFQEWGYSTSYYVTEDQEQTELRGKEIAKLKGPVKFAGLHNAHAFPIFNNVKGFYVPLRKNETYCDEKPLYPQFSRDFASIVYHGYTVTYIMLQLAYHLGFEEVYLIGLDHSYGKLSQLFPPGKITVTKDNYHLVQKCHFDKNYYKIGDQIGVPHVTKQEEAYNLAKQIFEEEGRKIFNASVFSNLNIFTKIDFRTIFD